MLSGSTLKAADPELHYVGTKWDVYGRFVSVLTFENKSGRPLYFLGEDFNLPFLVKATPGKGETKILDDYGGADDLIYFNIRFASGKSIRFDGWDQPKAGEAWKMGLRYTFNSQKDAKLERIAWSETITGSPGNSVLPDVSSRVYLEGHREKNSERAYRFLLKNISRKPLYYIGYRESNVPPKLELETEKQIHFWRNEGEVQGEWGEQGSGFNACCRGSQSASSCLLSATFIGVSAYDYFGPQTRRGMTTLMTLSGGRRNRPIFRKSEVFWHPIQDALSAPLPVSLRSTTGLPCFKASGFCDS